MRWIPKVGGGAVAVIGGSPPGLLDAQTGNFVPFSPDARLVIEASRSAKGWLGPDWIALHDGSVRGRFRNGAVAITRDGRLEPPGVTREALPVLLHAADCADHCRSEPDRP
ncbi:MAG: hypothetical protein WDO69_19730 [Pseudomonadota bacterium]